MSNIVEGLVEREYAYGFHTELDTERAAEWPERGRRPVHPGCGMGDVLRADAERAVLAVPGVDEVRVNLVWEPPWTIGRMSQAARLQLGLL